MKDTVKWSVGRGSLFFSLGKMHSEQEPQTIKTQEKRGIGVQIASLSILEVMHPLQHAGPSEP